MVTRGSRSGNMMSDSLARDSEVSKMLRPPRPRLTLDIAAIPTYAIGDIHGRYDLLVKAEEAILRDGAQLPGRKLIVTLGDYIDRGPDSAKVITHLLEPLPDGFDRICLAGNHEVAMLDYIDGWVSFDDWMQMGSAELLKSYGLDTDHLPLVLRTGAKLDAFLGALEQGVILETVRTGASGIGRGERILIV